MFLKWFIVGYLIIFFSIALILEYSFMGSAGVPIMVLPWGTFLLAAELTPIMALFSTVTRFITIAPGDNQQLFLTFADPNRLTWAVRTLLSPIIQLWPIWQWLLICVWSPIWTAPSNRALPTVTRSPIHTWLPIYVPPTWRVLKGVPWAV